jgi:conjugative transfer signal peptidase TraF
MPCPRRLDAVTGGGGSRSAYVAALICGTALIAWTALRSAPPVLLFNPSNSAPRGWYLLSREPPTRAGQFALARLPAPVAQIADDRRYLPLGTHLLKGVGGVPGDYVCADGNEVRINRRTVARTLTEDAAHRPLTPWRGCGLLSASQYFLLSTTNSASFDSRYFGPLERADVVGRAAQLWTWP